jgi:hypothetical protein
VSFLAQQRPLPHDERVSHLQPQTNHHLLDALCSSAQKAPMTPCTYTAGMEKRLPAPHATRAGWQGLEGVLLWEQAMELQLEEYKTSASCHASCHGIATIWDCSGG